MDFKKDLKNLQEAMDALPEKDIAKRDISAKLINNLMEALETHHNVLVKIIKAIE